uniref:TIR domain-containing protein n=1 Tax=Sus scrofa TaxID=9823 RepID=A0A8D0RLI5_PIG
MGSCPAEDGAAPAIPQLRPSEKFHLFVSYSSVDAAWTHGLIGRLEADHAGLRVCLHERDFMPGRNVLENMADCIQRSQKVLLVLSQDFVQSRWCLLEADLSLFGSCLERKPVIPVLLSPCRIPLHLSHLTYLEATDGRFYQKVVQLLCTPNHRVARPPGLRAAPTLYSGKTLLSLDCVNRESLPSWRVGTFSTLAVPDPLREVLEDPEVYKQALGILNGVRSPRSCLRYLGCRVTLGVILILLSMASVFLPLVLGIQENHPARRFLLISANVFFCPLLMVLSVNTLCWFRRFSKRKMRELTRSVGEANLLLAPHSVLMGCDTRNKLYFVCPPPAPERQASALVLRLLEEPVPEAAAPPPEPGTGPASIHPAASTAGASADAVHCTRPQHLRAARVNSFRVGDVARVALGVPAERHGPLALCPPRPQPPVWGPLGPGAPGRDSGDVQFPSLWMSSWQRPSPGLGRCPWPPAGSPSRGQVLR